MSSPRISPITERRGLSGEQLDVFDRIVASRGRLPTPSTVLLHRPVLADHAESIGAYVRFRSSLGAAVRESVILTVAAARNCSVEWRGHSASAVAAGVDPAVVEALRAGRDVVPAGEVGLAIEFARELVQRDRVPTELFDRAREQWGDDGVLDLVATVAYYSFLAVVLNAFEVEPP